MKESKILPRKSVLLVGNVGVGKTTLFERLCVPSSSRGVALLAAPLLSIPVGRLRGSHFAPTVEEIVLWDMPGMPTLFTQNEDEMVSRHLLLSGEVDAILQVLDAKNLRRSLVLALQLAEFAKPTCFVLNMLDEAENRGIEIALRRLEALLDAPLQPTVALESLGVEEIPALIKKARIPKIQVVFSPPVEGTLDRLGRLLQGLPLPPRALGIMLLGRSTDARRYVSQHLGEKRLEVVDGEVEALQREVTYPLDVLLTESYSTRAEKIVQHVQQVHQQSPRLMMLVGRWAQRFSTGIPMALAILVAMYYWVGVFGATFLVDLLNNRLFTGLLTPLLKKAVAPIPSIFIQRALVDDNFGILTTGLFLAFGIVLPVLFCFYLFFGLLEESGYLPRFSVLLNRTLQHIGLNGKGLIPLIMGLSCVTMAILTTRMLDTRRERNIATFLLILGLPCAPLFGVMLVILSSMPWYASFFVFGFIVFQVFFTGFLANHLFKGKRTDFMLELPPMRVPKLRSLLQKTGRRVYFFMKEAIPAFLLAAFLVFLFDYIGGLRLIERVTRPLLGSFLGLPEQSVRVLIKTIVRRESGAAELELLKGYFSNLQLVVMLLTMTFLMPCVNSTIVLFKERGARTALAILLGVFFYSLFLGGMVYHACHALGITFA